MTLQEFVVKNLGKPLDYDGSYRNQCVDLYRFYIKDVWNIPQTPKVIGAHQIINTLPPGFEIIKSGIPLPGDVIIWNEKLVKDGHVAVVITANKSTFQAFQQNAPKPYQPANIAYYTYKNVIGWFRPIKEDTMLRTYKKTIYALVAGYWIAVGINYQDFLQDFGGQIAPEMTEAQFKAFPVHKRLIK